MAVAVVAGIAAVGGAAVSAVVAGTALTFGAAAAAFAIGAGLSVVSRALAPKPKLNTGASLAGLTATVREPATSKKIVYGRSRIGGTVVYITTSGADNKYLHIVIAMAGHEIDAFESVYFNDEKVWQGTYQSGWGSYARIKFYKGDQTTADSDLVSESAAWTSDHILRDTAYLYVRLEYDPDQFPNGIPNISAVVRGKKIYDPRQDSTSSFYDASVGVDTHRVNDSSTWTWSQNPALAVRDYLVDTKYGLGEDAGLINESALVSAADYCDIDLDSNSDPIPQLQINGIVDTANSRKENIDSMLSAMGGMLVYSGGLYFIRAAQYVSPTITIDESVMVGQIQVQTRQSRRSQYNGVKGVFLSKEKNYTVADYPAQISSTYATEDGDPIYLDMPLPFVTDNEQAQRLAKIALLKSRQQTVITVPVNLAGLKFKAGDVINVTNERMGYDQKPFEVVDYAIAIEPSGGIRVDLRCIETASSIYNWLSSDAEDFLSGGEVTLYDGKITQPPTNLVVSEGSRIDSDGTVIPTIDVSWTASNDAFIDHYEVEWKKQADSVYKTINTVGTEFEIPIPEVGFTFDVRVRAVNALGVRSSYASTTVTLSGDTTAPGVPTNLSVSADNHLILITWDNPTDSDFLHVEIKSAAVATEGSATLLAKVDAEAYSDGPFSVGTTRYYWLRSVDRSGNASAWVSAGGDTTVVLETVDLTTEVHNSVLAQEILNVELENETILDLETGLEVDIQNLGDVAIFVNESNATLDGRITANNNALSNLQNTVVDLTSGVSDIYLQATAPVAGVGGVPDPIPTFSRWYDTDDNNAPYYWDGSQWLSLEDPRIGTNESAITSLSSRMSTAEGEIDANTAAAAANASDISANADAISTLDTTVTAQGDTIAVLSTSNTELTATLDFITKVEDEAAQEPIDLETSGVLDLETLDDVTSATSSAIQTLEVQTTAISGTISTQATQIAALESALSVDGEFSATVNAVETLGTRVTVNEDDLETVAGQITALQNTVNNEETGVEATASAVEGLDTRVGSAEGSISANADAVLALQVVLQDPDGNYSATANAVQTFETVLANEGGTFSATSNAITEINTTVGDNSASISTQAESIDGLEAQYTVKIDNNGRVAGFGLASTTPTNTTDPAFSEFVVIADQFSIVNPASTADTPLIPFQVSAGKATFTSDVVINGDLITTGTITATRLNLNGTMFTAPSGVLTIADGGVDSDQLASGSVGIAKFASGLQPIQVVDTLPASAAEGDQAYLTTDKKLYRYNGSAWIKAVDGADVSAGTLPASAIVANSITAGQIEAGAIGATEISVTNLAAISADLGTVTAGSLASSLITGDISTFVTFADTTSQDVIEDDGEVVIQTFLLPGNSLGLQPIIIATAYFNYNTGMDQNGKLVFRVRQGQNSTTGTVVSTLIIHNRRESGVIESGSINIIGVDSEKTADQYYSITVDVDSGNTTDGATFSNVRGVVIGGR